MTGNKGKEVKAVNKIVNLSKSVFIPQLEGLDLEEGKVEIYSVSFHIPIAVLPNEGGSFFLSPSIFSLLP